MFSSTGRDERGFEIIIEAEQELSLSGNPTGRRVLKN